MKCVLLRNIKMGLDNVKILRLFIENQRREEIETISCTAILNSLIDFLYLFISEAAIQIKESADCGR
jgi:hypothetical protein